MKVKGSVSLITGGSQGFGRAFSRELLKRGGKVTVVDIDDETGLKTCKDFSKEFGEGSAHFIHCDVTNTDHLEGAFNETINKFGRLDILCNNAGGLVHNWKKLVELNLTSVIHGTFLGIKHMKAANKGAGGVIVNVGSLSGLFPFRDAPVYSATKFGVVGFTQSLKKANTRENIRVNCLCPSFSPTTMVEKGLEARPEMRPFVEKIGIVPIEDVAKGFIELVHDDTKDGEVLTVTVKGLVYVKARHEHFPVEPKL
ncbi:15-hydroxyprostaglandin dehydrogenase [NAD(+)]-like [Rhopilema esculentum]|uniref:15-hydroxyprostaglandin dehydrogenase [NAD(+)]-like n=1 Tax=Rhopilema esculentum TaxID=499914 RepID=UPI0031DF73AD